MGIPSDATSNKILVFFSIWCLLALPIHYYTCSVERNSIPSLDSVLNKSVTFPLHINIHCISQAEELCTDTNRDAVKQIQQQFDHIQATNRHLQMNITHKTHNKLGILSDCTAHKHDVLYLNCLQSISQQTKNEIGSYDLYLIRSTDAQISEITSGSQWIVSPFRSAWVHIINNDLDHVMEQLHVLMDKMIYASLESSQVNMAMKQQIFSFTLLNSEPEIGHRFAWDMNEIHRQYLLPFFNRIHNILLYDYHIDSQILHYGYIISQPPTDDIHVDRADFNTILANYIQKDTKDDSFYVTNTELETFVGGTDWNRVSSLVSNVSPIQFVVYVPPKKYSPLYIKSKNKRNPYNAFLVQRFGGCVIYNANATNGIEIDTEALHPTFNLIISQLRLLLGLRNDYDAEQNAIFFLMDETGLNDWELDVLIRAHIVSDLQTVELALNNIYAMIHKVSQLPIKLDVASLISDAVHAFHEALISCNENKSYIECIQWTKHSNHLAKKAEYHDSMLPALYFSPEFTYAVYSPYFLPGYIPIVAAVFKKLKAKYKEWRARQNTILNDISDFSCLKTSNLMELDDDLDLGEWMPSTLNDDKAAQKQIRKAKAAQRQIIKMMYGGGDDENPLPESVALMENIITHFIQSFCIDAQNLADKNDRSIRVEDFLFLIRKDIHKYKRVSELLGFNDFLKTLRKDDYETIQNIHFVDNKRKKK